MRVGRWIGRRSRSAAPGEGLHLPCSSGSWRDLMLQNLRNRASDESGFTLIELARRHPDHRHPGRDRPADVPGPAREGAGRLREVQRPQRRHPDGVLHRRRVSQTTAQAVTDCGRLADVTGTGDSTVIVTPARRPATSSRDVEVQRRLHHHEDRHVARLATTAPAPAARRAATAAAGKPAASTTLTDKGGPAGPPFVVSASVGRRRSSRQSVAHASSVQSRRSDPKVARAAAAARH